MVTDRRESDTVLQEHLAECVECWDALAEQEKHHGIDLRLPARPRTTSSGATAAHDPLGSDDSDVRG